MALTVTNIANLLFKSSQGKSSTVDTRQFFEEPRDGRQAVFTSQIWSESGDIPNTAPVLAPDAISGVVQYKEDLALTAVPGTTNAFSSDDLIDAIPFNFGDGTSYNYALKDSLGSSIPFGTGDWIVDGDTGTVTFYGTVPSNMPPTISFYKYVGTKADVGGLGGGGGAGAINWYLPPNYSGPLDTYEDIVPYWEFDYNDSAQSIFTMIKVPESYKAGDQIFLRNGLLKVKSTDTTRDVLMRASVYHILPGNPYTNLVGVATPYSSTNTEVAVTALSDEAISIGDIDITNSSGVVSGNAVVPGESVLLVRLQRATSSETLSYQGSVFVFKDSFTLALKAP